MWRGRAWDVVQAVGWLGFACVVVFLGVTLGSSVDRTPPILASTVEGKPSATAYRPGDTFAGVWHVKAVKACDGYADRLVKVDPQGGGTPWVYRLNDVPVRLSDFGGAIPGTIEYPINTFTLPPNTPVGKAHYYHLDHFTCLWPGQWFFPVEVIYQPIVFDVVPR
jgi:hypothetical protein